MISLLFAARDRLYIIILQVIQQFRLHILVIIQERINQMTQDFMDQPICSARIVFGAIHILITVWLVASLSHLEYYVSQIVLLTEIVCFE